LKDDFQIGEWLIQPQLNLIQSGGKSVRVKPRSMAVLVFLAEARGEVVEKYDLMDAVWGQSVVTEDVLTQSIVELRKAFGDSASDPKVIETIRRVGFRLLPQVTDGTSPAAPHTSKAMLIAVLAGVLVLVAFALYWRQTEVASVTTDPSVAVLPFVNLSDEPGTDFFSDGLSEEVLNTLTLIPGLRVPARTSSFAFRDRDEDVRVIGRSLNVATVLEGSVRRAGRQIRVTAQLIDVESGYHIWSQTYDRELEDVFAVQSDIARSLTEALKVTLGGDGGNGLQQSGTSDADAYELYLLGRHHLDNELGDWIIKARTAFGRAIEADPGFARAYAGLADTYLVFRETPGSFMQGDSIPFDEALMHARRAVDRALELNPSLADAYVSRAAISAARRDWLAEEEDLRTAAELNPSLVPAYLRLGANLRLQGMPDQALEAYKKAAGLDPLNPKLAASLARLTAELGDYDTAITYPLKLLDSGLRSPLPLEALVEINRVYGRFVDRVKWARELVRLAPTRASAQAELADAYLELGEFELADSWAKSAHALSSMEALKVRARLYGVRNDIVGMMRLLKAVEQANLPPPPQPLSPAQSMIAALAGITYYLAGEFAKSARSFERVIEQSWSIHRRSPEVPVMAQNWLALAYLGDGDLERARTALATALELVAGTSREGYGRYPPLLWEKAISHGLSGQGDEALAAWREAIALGWRHFYIQGNELNPLKDSYAKDSRYQESSRFLEEEAARMRNEVRARGWAETPEAYFARDQLKVTVAN
jgi:TolB-like protein/DNA-binding winged helix-turn-helix (wHTH) protein/tetratricopeptide (TPR) repeat protein